MDHPLYPDGCDPAVVALAGDWHGNAYWAVRMIEKIAIETPAKLIVHLGDFGYWRMDPSTIKYISRQNRLLAAHDMALAFVDGNHEDHDRLNALPIDDGVGLRKVTNRIWHLPRGLRWTWAGRTWLALGGAVSVDRSRRRAGRDWWPTEVVSTEDASRAMSAGPADVMVSHDCPSGVDIPGLTPSQWPPDAVADSESHRELLRRVVDAVRPRRLWHGHYHVCYRADLDLGTRPDLPERSNMCEVRGLDCDEGAWRNNIALVGVDGSPTPWPKTQ